MAGLNEVPSFLALYQVSPMAKITSSRIVIQWAPLRITCLSCFLYYKGNNILYTPYFLGYTFSTLNLKLLESRIPYPVKIQEETPWRVKRFAMHTEKTALAFALYFFNFMGTIFIRPNGDYKGNVHRGKTHNRGQIDGQQSGKWHWAWSKVLDSSTTTT